MAKAFAALTNARAAHRKGFFADPAEACRVRSDPDFEPVLGAAHGKRCRPVKWIGGKIVKIAKIVTFFMTYSDN